jgi:NADH-quinone oxidoreductase subunit E
MALATRALSAERREQLDQVIARNRGRPGALLSILEQIQESQDSKYLPRPMLDYLSRAMGVAASQMQSVATFYSFFNLEPQGRHTVCICRGTACHTRGSRELLDTLKDALSLRGEAGEAEKVAMTTADGQVTVRTVACIGQCALAPVIEVDRSIQGHVTERQLKARLAGLLQEGS